MSLVLGVHPSGTTPWAMWGVNKEDTSTGVDGVYYLAVDPLTVCSSDCDVDPDDYAIDFIEVNDLNPPAWAPGAASAFSIVGGGPDPGYFEGMAFVTALGTIGNSANTDYLCDSADTPPQLLIYTWAGSSFPWEKHSIALDVPGASASTCYEDDHDHTGTVSIISPIDVVSGVVLVGSTVYIATDDGRFWEYDTIRGLTAEDPENTPNGFFLEGGYSGPWPRFRKDNQGSAARY